MYRSRIAISVQPVKHTGCLGRELVGNEGYAIREGGSHVRNDARPCGPGDGLNDATINEDHRRPVHTQPCRILCVVVKDIEEIALDGCCSCWTTRVRGDLIIDRHLQTCTLRRIQQDWHTTIFKTARSP